MSDASAPPDGPANDADKRPDARAGAGAGAARGGDGPVEKGGDGPGRFRLEAGKDSRETLARLQESVGYWVSRGRYNKVRVKRGGKPILPDIPIGALLAVEAATFFWTGLLRAAIVNVAGRAFFEVELVNDAEQHYKTGLEHFLAGELPDAEVHLQKALKVDPRYARAHLQMGVLRRMQGKKAEARDHFSRVVALDPHSDAAKEAGVHLKKMG
jgi:tetratricopeptide (TPR) repeat protein